MLAGRSLLRRLAGLPAAARHVSATSSATVRQQKEEPKLSLEQEASDREMLEMLRYHNSTLPGLEGQVVYGKILRVERNHVLVDAGFKSCTRLNKRELQLSQLVASRDASVRTSRDDFRVGDVLLFVVEALQTPYGDMSLRANRPQGEEKYKLVWRELEVACREGRPVKGRILNNVNGGFAVGIAGIVAFCPFSQCSLKVGSRVGVLQEFLITRMSAANNNIVVCDAHMPPSFVPYAPRPWNTAGSAAALVEREGAGRGNPRPGGRPQTGRPPEGRPRSSGFRGAAPRRPRADSFRSE